MLPKFKKSVFKYVLAASCLMLPSAALASASENLPQFLTDYKQWLHVNGGTGAGFAIVRREGVEFAGGIGLRDRPAKLAVDENTAFPVASVSKIFIALAVHMLIEEGTLSLDDEVNTVTGDVFINNPFSGHPVRIRHLLDHTSGISEMIAPALPDNAGYPAAETLLRLAPYVPEVRNPPGQYPTYSNYNYVLLAHIIEIRTGKPFDQWISEQILVPAGMTRSSFRQTHYRGENFATGYRNTAGIFSRVPHREGFYRAAAGMISTPADLAQFLLLLLNDGKNPSQVQVVPARAVRALEQLSGELAASHQMQVGHALGLVIREKSVWTVAGHNGINDGYMASLFYNRAQGFGLAVMYNAHLLPSSPSLGHATDKILDTFFQNESDPSQVSPPVQDELALEPGIYRLVNPRFEILGFSSYFQGLVVIRKQGPDLYQGDLFNEGHPLYSAGPGLYRYSYERKGHLASGKKENSSYLFLAPNRYYEKITAAVFVLTAVPVYVCLLMLLLGVGDMLWSLTRIVWRKKTKKSSKLAATATFVMAHAGPLCFTFITAVLLLIWDSETLTTFNARSALLLILTTLALPLSAASAIFQIGKSRGQTTDRLRHLFIASYNTASALLFLLMASSGFFAIRFF